MGAGAGAPPPAAGTPPPMAASAPMADNVAGALCYVFGLLTGIIFLVLAPYSQNRAVRFHAFQSIFLNVSMIVLWIVLTIVLGILGHIPVLGALFALLLGLLWLVFALGFFGLWLYLLIQTYQGKTVVLPIIGSLAQKQA
jgi:uncharacterized membrane protein